MFDYELSIYWTIIGTLILISVVIFNPLVFTMAQPVGRTVYPRDIEDRCLDYEALFSNRQSTDLT